MTNKNDGPKPGAAKRRAMEKQLELRRYYRDVLKKPVPESIRKLVERYKARNK